MNYLVDAATILGTFVAIATFTFVFMDWRKATKLVPPVFWTVAYLGRAKKDGAVHDRLSITNAGRENAILYSIGIANATPVTQDDLPVKNWVIAPGKPIELLIDCASVDDVWVMLQWMEPTDKTCFVYEWLPIAFTSPLLEELEQSNQRQRTGFPKRRRRAWGKPVGPGGYRKAAERTDKAKRSATAINSILIQQDPMTLIYPDLIQIFDRRVPAEPDHHAQP